MRGLGGGISSESGSLSGTKDGSRGRERSHRGVLAVSGTAMAGLAAVGLFAVSCSAGGTGTRDEGPARSDPVAAKVNPTPTAKGEMPSAAPRRVDPVELLKNDPKVSESVKRDLKPCAKDIYPVDASYGRVTANTADDVVVNVMTCGDAVGIGSYVFREENGRYTNVFVAEEPAVYAEIDRGDLVVTRPEYKKGDPLVFPSGEVVVTYRWAGHKFTEHDRVENSYSKDIGYGDDGRSSKEQLAEQDAKRKAAGEAARDASPTSTATPSSAPAAPRTAPPSQN
ncbi:hypothetical protein [Streptomyces sp. NPDC048442]|uniref:hypothetical protein n=1 Tax=Streptomyces sp. NPDC048442 TaxID=3154823 RepID=UPI0034139BFD